MKRLSEERLRALRNLIPIHEVIHHLELPAKVVEGYLRFLCPRCSEFHTATNSRTNLARCFRCSTNYNPIDLVVAVRKLGFLDVVQHLERHFAKHLPS